MTAPSPIDLVLERLDDAREIAPEKWQAFCPAHEDRHPSLSVGIGDENRVLLTCRANCATRDVVDALGLEMSDLFDDERGARRHGDAPLPTRRPRPPKIKAPVRPPEPLPTDEDLAKWHSALIESDAALEKCRTSKGWSKGAIERLGIGVHDRRLRFPIRDGMGELINVVKYKPEPAEDEPKSLALRDRPRGLFPAPETIKGGQVWLVEGEPDAVTGTSLGLPAVGVPGVQGWKTKYAQRFDGKRVVICMDCDEHGRKVAEQIAADLAKRGTAHKIIDLAPSRTDGFDLSDYITQAETGGDARTNLLALAKDEKATTAGVKSKDAPTVPQETPEAEIPATADVLDALIGGIRKVVILTDEQYAAVALWVLHTYVYENSSSAAYLSITSPEKKCGKSRLMEMLGRLVNDPLPSANASVAAIFRAMGEPIPWREFSSDIVARGTLLYDEVDGIWAGKGSENEELRTLLNAGYRRGAPAVRCVGEGSKQVSSAYPSFAPKALAGIGDLPDTLADRCVPIRLQRMLGNQKVIRGREAEQKAIAEPLKTLLTQWWPWGLEQLEGATPELPDILDGRECDTVDQLIAIADLASPEWGERAREAFIGLYERKPEGELSRGVQLLASIREVFDEERLSSTDLARRLRELEDAPWRSWNNGEGITASNVAKELKGYGIRPEQMKFDGENHRGYRQEWFEDVWERYVPKSMRQGPIGTPLNESTGLPGAFVSESLPFAPSTAENGNGNGHSHLSDEELESLAAMATPNKEGIA